MVTTESATADATVANRPAGASGLLSVSSVTFDVVNASTVSAVLLPTQPPMNAMTMAMISRVPSASQETLPPKSTSRTPSFPTGASATVGDDGGTAGVPSDGAAFGSRHGSAGCSGGSVSAANAPASAGGGRNRPPPPVFRPEGAA